MTQFFKQLRILSVVFLLLGMAHGQEAPVAQGIGELPPRQPLDPAVATSAQKAVQSMVDEVMKGQVKVAFEKMYPRWKKKEAKRRGGMLKLEQKLATVVRIMREQGVVILKYQALKPVSGHEAWPEAEKKLMNGVRRPTGNIAYRDWVVFVPTIAYYKIPNPNNGKVETVERKSFQVAVMSKHEGKWTFIDGSNIQAKDLRILFPSLPGDAAALNIPKPSGRVLP